MAKPPAFQLYAADFYMDTNGWTPEEVGIYFRLLMDEWVNGELPNDTKRLAFIAQCSYKKFQFGWEIIQKKFIQNGKGFLVNKRLEEVRQNQLNYSESRRKNVITRYKDKSTYVDTHVKHMELHTPRSSSSSSSSSSLTTKKKNNTMFIKPSLEEVKEYCKERNKGIDPEAWYDHYLANGWKVGRVATPMKDWKATIRTWERNRWDTGKQEPLPVYIPKVDENDDPWKEEMEKYKRGEL